MADAVAGHLVLTQQLPYVSMMSDVPKRIPLQEEGRMNAQIVEELR
jgi:hypothetical protein